MASSLTRVGWTTLLWTLGVWSLSWRFTNRQLQEQPPLASDSWRHSLRVPTPPTALETTPVAKDEDIRRVFHETTHAPRVVDKTWPPRHVLDALVDSQHRLVVMASTYDMADVCDNLCASLLAVNVTNFVIIPLDEAAYQVLSMAYPHQTIPVPPVHILNPTELEVPSLLPLSSHTTREEIRFGSVEFQRLTATRPRMLRPFLERNYTILYTDVDMVWRRNAWTVLEERQRLASDRNTNINTNDTIVWQDGRGQLCTCLLYLVPTPATLVLLDQWHDVIEQRRGRRRRGPRGTYETDQTAFVDLAKQLAWPMRGGRVDGVTVYPSDAEFPPGKWYAWNDTVSSAENAKAVMVHNNWISGQQAKMERFQRAGLWKPSGRLRTAGVL